MTTYPIVIFYSLIGGIFSLIGGVFLLTRRSAARKLTKYATPFAAGALLSAVFLDLLSDAAEEDVIQSALLWTLIGLVLFFFLEHFLHWFHHHHEHAKKVEDAKKDVPLIIIGDTIHNALDGIAIASSFLISVPTGIVTTIAVAAHEIPQEIGDFGLLLARGLSRKKVLLVNVVSALATTLLAVITFALGSESALPVGALLGISAGFLLYIATSDLIPTIHEHAKGKRRFFDIHSLMLLAGVLIVALSIQLAHHFAGHA
jgi:zinc and cadmium transporter